MLFDVCWLGHSECGQVTASMILATVVLTASVGACFVLLRPCGNGGC